MGDASVSPFEAEIVKILYLVLGWLFGLFTLPIASGIRDRYLLAGVRKSLQVELDTLRYRAAHGAYAYAQYAGKWDKQLLRELLPSFALESRVALQLKTHEAVEGFLKLDDAQFATVASALTPGVTKGISAKRLSLPYLNSRLEFLPRFSQEAQRQLLELREQVEQHNQVVEEILKLNAMTFTVGGDVNLDTVNHNLQVQHGTALAKCRQIATISGDIKL